MQTLRETMQQACDHANKANEGIEAAIKYIERHSYIDEFFGIDYASVNDREIAFLERGDTYATTVIEEHGHCEVCSLGSWLEDAEQQHCENEGEIRCGWCSYFTPMDQEDWRDVVCEACGHHVDGGE